MSTRALCSVMSSTRLLNEARRDVAAFAEELELRIMQEAEDFETRELVASMELLRSRGSAVTRAVAKRVLTGRPSVAMHDLLSLGRHLNDADFQQLVLSKIALEQLNEPDLLTLIFETNSRKSSALSPSSVLSHCQRLSAAGIAKVFLSFPPSDAELRELLPRILADYASIRPCDALVLLNLIRQRQCATEPHILDALATDLAAGVSTFNAEQLLDTLRCGVQFGLWPVVADVVPRMALQLESLSASDALAVVRLLKSAKLAEVLPDLLPRLTKKRFRNGEALELVKLCRGCWSEELLLSVSEPLQTLSAPEKMELLKLLSLELQQSAVKKLFETISESLNFNQCSTATVLDLLETLVLKKAGTGAVRRRLVKSLRGREASLALDERIAMLFLSDASAENTLISNLSEMKSSLTLERLLTLVIRSRVTVDMDVLGRTVQTAISTANPRLLVSALAAKLPDDDVVHAVAERLVALETTLTEKELVRTLVVLAETSEAACARKIWTRLAKKTQKLSVENLLSCLWATRKVDIPVSAESPFYQVMVKKFADERDPEILQLLAKHTDSLQTAGVWDELEPKQQQAIWKLVQDPGDLRPPHWKRSSSKASDAGKAEGTYSISAAAPSRQFIDLVKRM